MTDKPNVIVINPDQIDHIAKASAELGAESVLKKFKSGDIKLPTNGNGKYSFLMNTIKILASLIIFISGSVFVRTVWGGIDKNEKKTDVVSIELGEAKKRIEIAEKYIVGHKIEYTNVREDLQEIKELIKELKKLIKEQK